MATFTLTGTGVQAISSPGSLAITVTVGGGSAQVGYANPANLYHVGLLRVGNTHGYGPAIPVDAVNMLLPCINGATLLGYALASGVTITAEERAEQPYAGPTGPPGATGASGRTLITDTTLGVAAASFDFTSISGAYSHLELRGYLRASGATQTTAWEVTFNGDTGANYNNQKRNTAAGTTTGNRVLNQNNISLGQIPAASDSLTDEYGYFIAEIPFYGSPKLKQIFIRQLMGPTGGTPVQGIYETYAEWANAAAITRVTINPASGNFVASCRCQLYGVS
jgi:hypothetical protein